MGAKPSCFEAFTGAKQSRLVRFRHQAVEIHCTPEWGEHELGLATLTGDELVSAPNMDPSMCCGDLSAHVTSSMTVAGTRLLRGVFYGEHGEELDENAPLANLVHAIVVSVAEEAVEVQELLQRPGITAEALLSSGLGVMELRTAGAAATQLQSVGFTAAQLKTGGFVYSELQALSLTGAELREAGFTAQELFNNHFDTRALRAAGFTARGLRSEGFTAGDLKRAGFSAAELVNAGFPSGLLWQAGCSERELLEAGCDPQEIRQAVQGNRWAGMKSINNMAS
eukprot:TRINITY_DN112668_c0_g1_i1.p1 TRINITY_DN112668_c0_g1~~TRINITY_DN112668_c0_g1_i1.p1  ORF type:complete len:282 (-),score=49.52 TRINITY_DN112668_c0_g1_i1:191-1036(-)